MKTSTKTGFCLALAVFTASIFETAHAQNAPLELRFKPRVGEQRVLRMEVAQDATQVLPKSKSTMRQEFTMDIEHDVKSADANGAIVRATVIATKFRRAVDGRVLFDYDSRRAEKNRPGTLTGDEEIGALMVGMPIEMQLSPRAEITSILNTDEIVDQMLEKMEVSQDSRPMIRGLMQKSIGENAFKNFGNLFASFPSTPVAIGESWPKRDVFMAESNLFAIGTLQFASLVNGFAKLENRAAIKPDASTPAANAQSAPPTGTQTGTYFVDPQTGWTRQANLTQRLTARFSGSGLVSANSKTGPMIYLKSSFRVSTLSMK